VASFRPLHDRVLVKRVKEEEKTRGGIIIPETAQEKPQEGEVVAVGPGTRDEDGERIELDVKPGDRILFGKWSGTEVKVDGEELLIMKESDIMGVIDEKKAKRPRGCLGALQPASPSNFCGSEDPLLSEVPTHGVKS
jgi:chaperonin GroES